MAEIVLSPTSAFAGIPRGRSGQTDGPPGVIASERTDLAMATIIARKGQSAALRDTVREIYGLKLPIRPTWVGNDELAFLWSGPDQWLALATGTIGPLSPLRERVGVRAFASFEDAASETTASKALTPPFPTRGRGSPAGGFVDIETELRESIGAFAAISAQGDGRAVLRLSGPNVHDTLAKGLPIDLHESAFKPGDVAITQIAHIGVTIRQIDSSPTYEIILARSLSLSFWSWLVASSGEFGLDFT
ncbi:hypothetical protein OSH11_11225 [Kaistia dalseonensis]|uniref:Sarcosine oxidase subunit gamma n=1 Tax=Kaistia dalseonensis TaxID=410840 RepID=A0ABU0H6E5_9HYPH|nr:sarcosine oxidase subunit gamma family protein [Kaistia dalseonensis]MCX5495280.1 hypothetical protein [Kaistia dalseonensis]MDQ0437866.1 sarcosine oxidase subunit gamma [Kaistia dalseonensis]